MLAVPLSKLKYRWQVSALHAPFWHGDAGGHQSVRARKRIGPAAGRVRAASGHDFGRAKWRRAWRQLAVGASAAVATRTVWSAAHTGTAKLLLAGVVARVTAGGAELMAGRDSGGVGTTQSFSVPH